MFCVVRDYLKQKASNINRKPHLYNYIIEFENIIFYRGLLCRCILQCRVCHKQEQKSLKTSGSQDQSRSTEEKATKRDIKSGYLESSPLCTASSQQK